jgi:hypothetical protein
MEVINNRPFYLFITAGQKPPWVKVPPWMYILYADYSLPH